MRLKEIYLTEDVSSLENRLADLEFAKKQARDITKDIKYANMATEIVARISTLAEEYGLKADESLEQNVFRAKNNLESAVYELEETFSQAIRSLQNKIDSEQD